MKVFIGCSASINEFDNNIIQRLNNMCKNELTVLFGDNDGTNTNLQKFFADKDYKDVIIYSMTGENRLNMGNWELTKVEPPPNKPKGFGYYAALDMEMIKECDYGFMIWDEKSKEVLYNSIRLAEENKTNVIYFNNLKKFVTISSMKTLKKVIEMCSEKVRAMFGHMTDPVMRNLLF